MELFRIPFPVYISTYEFEDTLKRYYTQSRKKQTEEVLFDFGKVQSCETFELSLTALWILHLLEKQKEVSFMFPRLSLFSEEKYLGKGNQGVNIKLRRDLYSYLLSCRFATFLDQHDVKSLGRSQYVRDPKPIQHPISPFVFFSIAENFASFMRILHRHTQMRIMFEELTNDLRIDQPEEIRNVILNEIGQNMFDHGSGRFAHIAMVKSDKYSLNIPKWEQTFFASLGNHGYLEVIISDKGPGIFRTLRDAYDRDSILPDKKENPDEYDILRYAFLAHTTKKSEEERLGELLSLLKDPELKGAIPSTGLYQVKMIVKEYGGFLSVRSGSSIVCYDFLSSPEGLSFTNTTDRSYKRLRNLGGTQFKIYFPFIDITSNRKLGEDKPYHFLEKSPSGQVYELICLASVMEEAGGGEGVEREASGLKSLFDRLHNIELSSTKEKFIVIDFEDLRLSNKALYILTIEIMRIQDGNTVIVGVNVDHSLPFLEGIHALVPVDSIQSKGMQKQGDFVVFSKNLKAFLISLSRRHKEIFRYLIDPLTFQRLHREDIPTNEEIKQFADRNSHLLEFDSLTNRYNVVISMSKLKEKIQENLRKQLSRIIKDPSKGIFHANGHFLISSGAYSEGYFQVNGIVDNPSSREKLIRWLAYWVEYWQTETLVTIGETSGMLGKKITDQIRAVNHINIQNAKERHDFYKLALMERDQKVTVVADVIGTERTVRSVLGACKHVHVLRILTVVDAREDAKLNDFIEFNGNKYKLVSILREPLSFWYKQMPSHWEYKNIIRIDPISGTPIIEPLKIKDPIWTKIDMNKKVNRFLDQVVRSTNSLIIGHFESTKKHIVYLFLTPIIAKEYKKVIAERISDDIDRFKSISHPDPKKRTLQITHVFYPQYTPGLKEIVECICLNFENSTPVPLARENIQRLLPIEQSAETNGVILFDDASATGYTVKRMMEIAEKAGARWIFVYILFNRADPVNARLLQKIQKYGKAIVEVQYLADIGIPSYDEANCPICKTIRNLKKLKEEIGDIDELKDLVEERMAKLEKKPIAVVLSPEGCRPYLSTSTETRVNQGDLRWKLEKAKEDISYRKYLANIVKNSKDEIEKALLFFGVLSQEKEYFLEDRKTFNEIFYESFRESVVDACIHFIAELDKFSEDDADNIFSVLQMFNDKMFMDLLGTILKKASRRVKLFNRVILHVFFSNETKQHPTRTVRILKDFKNSPLICSKLSATLDKSIQYWETKSKNIRPSKIMYVVKAFKELRSRDLRDSGLLGCLSGFICDLNEYERGLLDSKEIRKIIEKYWLPMRTAVTDIILPKLNLLKESDVSSEMSQKLELAVPEIRSLVTRAQELVDLIVNNEVKSNRFDDATQKLAVALSRLKLFLIEDKAGTVPHFLNLLITELKNLTERIISHHKEEIEGECIQVYVDKPEDACMVFGQESDICVIADNLVDNIIKRAFKDGKVGEKKMKIVIRKNVGTGKACLCFLDNGKGVEKITFGTGLNEVELRTEKIGGRFHLASLPMESPYNTEMKVELNYMPYRDES